MKQHHRIAALAAYGLGFWITFGHAWAHIMFDQLLGALGCALFWPLYWSGWFWSH